MGRKALLKEEFIKRAIKIYGPKYDYSNSDYKGTNSTIKIVCPRHGIFHQYPFSHIKFGCRKCRSEDRFIKNANKLYKNKFDYSKVKFTRMCDKIEIVCPKHGSFFTSPDYHLVGTGCKKCNKESK